MLQSLESRCVYALSHVQLFATPWTLTHQALLSMGFSRQEFWSGFPQTLGHLSPTHVHTMLTWGLRGRQEFYSEHGRREAGWGQGGRHPSPCCIDPAPHRRNRSAHTHTHTHIWCPAVSRSPLDLWESLQGQGGSQHSRARTI